ncbi:sigma factor-like helix-turn-helix DNA-binding protein [Sphingobium sp. AN558]|uniref:RNA polymerase sigma factor n=1 Tax=Sphingobium sp. AN558 TaxID=3133442 RepID=UPI0030BB0A6A
MRKDIPSVLALLREAREFIDAIPPLALLNAPRRSGRMLVAKIDNLFAAKSWQKASVEAVDEVRARWGQESAIRVDDGAITQADAAGLWVSGWLLAGRAADSIDVEAFRRALDSLPLMAREVYQLHRIEGRALGEVAQRLGMSSDEVETLLFVALRGLHARIYGGGA